MKKPSFIVFEGPRGVGKSTHVDLLYNYLLNKNIRVKKTHEIGGTVLGEKIRSLILSNQGVEIDRVTELLMILAARREHVKEIQGWLENDYIVICDRYIYSTIIYQSLLDGLDCFMALHNKYCYGLYPDKLIFLDGDQEVLNKRIISRNRKEDKHSFSCDRMNKIILDYQKLHRLNEDSLSINTDNTISNIQKLIRLYIEG